MVSTLHPSILTAAEGSVRKTYYKRDFVFLSSHFLYNKIWFFNKKLTETRNKHVNNFYSLERCAKLKIIQFSMVYPH